MSQKSKVIFAALAAAATLGAAQTLCFWESLKTLETSIAVLLFYVARAEARVGRALPFDLPRPGTRRLRAGAIDAHFELVRLALPRRSSSRRA